MSDSSHSSSALLKNSEASGSPDRPTSGAFGYRRKPLWIYLVAAVFILTPLGNLIYSLASLRIPYWYRPSVWGYWAKYVAPSTWVLLGLLFSSGVSLLFVRRWSWIFSLITLAVVSIYDIIMIRHFSIMGTLAITLMILGTVAFGLVLYFTEFRKPYLNPRVRWWETQPRYRVDLPVVVFNESQPATLIDISRSGVLIEWPAGAKIPDLGETTRITLPTQVDLQCTVTRRTAHGYGLQFRDQSRGQKKAVRHFIETLAFDPTKLTR